MNFWRHIFFMVKNIYGNLLNQEARIRWRKKNHFFVCFSSSILFQNKANEFFFLSLSYMLQRLKIFIYYKQICLIGRQPISTELLSCSGCRVLRMCILFGVFVQFFLFIHHFINIFIYYFIHKFVTIVYKIDF